MLRRPTRPARPIGIVVLLALCAGLVAWHYSARRTGGISLPESGAFWVLRPAQRVLSGVWDWGADVGRVMVRRNNIVDENRELRNRVADLEGTNQRLQRYRHENEELRQLLKMPRPPGGSFVAADIISLDATEYARRMILNVGTRRGVHPKDVVYTAHGVVGQVIASDHSTSTVLLLTDRQGGAGAMIARTMARGIVRGTGGRTCKMEDLDFHADVRAGDLVLTSGLVVKEGGVFPKGLVIGRVLKVERDKTYSRMIADIDPAVPFDQISAVWVRVKGKT